MSNDVESQDGAGVRFPPPLVPVIGLVVGVALEWWVWPIQMEMPSALRIGMGGVLVVVGLALMLAAFGLFRSTGQDPTPWASTPEIISAGIYGYTRNPMYVSMGLLQAGIGVLLANVWVVALVPVTWWTIYLIAIRHEEAYLIDKFDSVYRDYKNSVRRWL
jgi:protein-S-isoprenylcysteine O-methyltransferase Ste14